MAETLQFEIVSPEQRLASGDMTEVVVPGVEGQMTVMQGHLPLISSLRPGFVRASGGEGAAEYVVTHGFVEVTADAVSVLAEKAFPSESASKEEVQAVLEEARKSAEQAPEEHKDAAEIFVADLVELLERME